MSVRGQKAGGALTKDRKGNKGSGVDVSNFSESDSEFDSDVENEEEGNEVKDGEEDEDE